MKKNALTCLLLAAAFPAYADTITHFVDGPFEDIVTLLDDVGIGSGTMAAESTAGTFFVPGESGNVDITFHFEADLGAFEFEFGFFDVNAVMADPLADPMNFAVQALSNGTAVFDDTVDDPGATETYTVAAGTELGFYLIPNNTSEEVLHNPERFFDQGRPPLFSLSDANPGSYDQFLAFIGEDASLFSFEDLSRDRNSDGDFNDFAFSIDTALFPTGPPPPVTLPEPSTVLLLGIGALGLLARYQGSPIF